MVLKPLDGLIINASSSVDPDDPTPASPKFPFGPFMVRLYKTSTVECS
jgi:hypothetical protein